MNSLRVRLVGVANFLLFALVVIVPIIAFLTGGHAVPNYRNEFDFRMGAVSGVIAFLIGLPSAAFLAVFLDIREQLAQLNKGQPDLPIYGRPPAPVVRPVRSEPGIDWNAPVQRDSKGLTDLSRF